MAGAATLAAVALEASGHANSVILSGIAPRAAALMFA